MAEAIQQETGLSLAPPTESEMAARINDVIVLLVRGLPQRQVVRELEQTTSWGGNLSRIQLRRYVHKAYDLLASEATEEDRKRARGILKERLEDMYREAREQKNLETAYKLAMSSAELDGVNVKGGVQLDEWAEKTRRVLERLQLQPEQLATMTPHDLVSRVATYMSEHAEDLDFQDIADE